MTEQIEGSDLHKQYEVLVCAGESVYAGTLRCDFSQRLIDALNEGMRTETSEKLVSFLPLIDVTVTGARGEQQKLPLVYVAKNNIVFAAQVSDGREENPLRNYPYREKLPVGVMAYAAGVSGMRYTLDGRIYVETWGQVIDTVESESRFLPLTQVEISPAPPGAGAKYGFVALNKERIISIWQSPGQ